jgi:hypothetical protein
MATWRTPCADELTVALPDQLVMQTFDRQEEAVFGLEYSAVTGELRG